MIKFLIILLITLVNLISVPENIFAHSRGVPIFKINGQLTRVYPIESSSIKPFLSDSSDIASENYLVNQNLEFEFDPTRTELIPPQIDFSKIIYIWDFGDGTDKLTTNEPKASHSYAKMGSYILSIQADFSKIEMEEYLQQIVQQTLIHVLPNKEYKLPEPIIKINEKVAPPLQEASPGASYFDRLRLRGLNRIELDFNNNSSFDASESKSGTSRIIQYQWDLGQGDVKTGKKVGIKYKLPQALITPVLRVTDENGFIVDTYVNLENSGSNEPSKSGIKDMVSPLAIAISVQLILLVAGVLWYFSRRRTT